MSEGLDTVADQAKPKASARAGAMKKLGLYVAQRMREPVTWVSLGVAWNVIQDNWHTLFTTHSIVAVGTAACGVLIRSPGSPWLAGDRAPEVTTGPAR